MSNLVRQCAVCLAILCFAIGVSTTAFAVPPGEVLYDPAFHDISGGQCCFSFNETVSVIEPAKPVPVVLTYEVSFFEGSSFIVGLMVNGGPCTLYGSGFIPRVADNNPKAFQWIVFPADGLRAGTNTFTVCGGSVFFNTGFIDIQQITLAARLSN